MENRVGRGRRNGCGYQYEFALVEGEQAKRINGTNGTIFSRHPTLAWILLVAMCRDGIWGQERKANG
jgi:hypothetical protein